jgi:predicted DNA-binding transcriptional regulator AlpA
MNTATRADVFPPAVVTPSKKTPKDAPPMTIEEFCKRYALSRSHYFELKRQGRTPAEIRVGRKALITAASARAWERRVAQEQKAAQANG